MSAAGSDSDAETVMTEGMVEKKKAMPLVQCSISWCAVARSCTC